jgi:hypothetical protein
MDKYYEDEPYDFLSTDMNEHCKELLSEKGITNDKGDLKVNYSLGYSQGDGAMFVGTFGYKGIVVKVTSNDHHYTHANTASFSFYDENGEDIDDNEITNEFKSVYKSICHDLERWGYDLIEYRMSEQEFSEMADSNDWNFYESGKMANL